MSAEPHTVSPRTTHGQEGKLELPSGPPTVSVIIPAYNSGHYLDEAVHSVIGQSFTDWECMGVDDGSTEDLFRVEKLDPRVRLIRQENAGTCAARNRGIAASSADLIAFLDHDDVWLPNKLERQVSAMFSRPDVGLCYTSFEFIDGAGRCTGPGCTVAVTCYAEALENPGSPTPSSAVVRRKFLSESGLFDPFLMGVGDYDFFVRLLRFCAPWYIESNETRCRLHRGNTSGNYSLMHSDMRGVLMKHATFARWRGDVATVAAVERTLRRVSETYGAQAYDSARKSLRGGDAVAFVRHMGYALACSPHYTIAALSRFPVALVHRLAFGYSRAGSVKR